MTAWAQSTDEPAPSKPTTPPPAPASKGRWAPDSRDWSPPRSSDRESLKEFLARVRRQDEAHGGIRHRVPVEGCQECKTIEGTG